MMERHTTKARGGFTQWFGSCSLINTLYVWFAGSWAPMVAEQLFERSSESDNLKTFSMDSLPEGFPKIPPGMPGTNPRTRLLVQVDQRHGVHQGH